jgi:predicted DNA-binding transcriptional regulator YafY
MRAGRLLEILLVLQARGHATSTELATELEVSERTIHRDMDSLSQAGVPVYAERGRTGGWRLPDGYRSGPRGLGADELRALVLGTPGTVLGDLGLDRASESALTKLLLALPAAERNDLAEARKRVLVDLSTWRPTEVEAVPWLTTLHAAVAQERQVRIGYVRGDGNHAQRQVSPLGLVAKGRTWYLVACPANGEPRTYRVSRVSEATLTDEAAVVPTDFDLAEFWQASKARLVAGLPRFNVYIRTRASAVGELTSSSRWSRVSSIGPPNARGWVTLQMQFELEDDVCAAVLALGSRAELLAPAHLRQRLAAEAETVAAIYNLPG